MTAVEAEPDVWTVVLAGGIGSRFWPASTPDRPKQLLPLGSERPLIRDTVDRILPLVPADRLRILTGERLRGPLLGALPELDDEHLWIEPRAAGTGPALLWAAVRIARQSPGAVMVSLHADAAVDDDDAFRDDISRAVSLASEHGRLMTLGIVPDRAEVGYGYIRTGAPLGDRGGLAVDAFVEKPDLRTAEEYLASGGYLWNSGIFVWRVADLIEEVRARSPELARLLPLAEAGDAAGFFGGAEPISIDEGVLERSGRVGVIPARFGWDDVGSWEALFRTREADADGNVLSGRAVGVETTGCALYAEQGAVVAFDVDDLIVVRTGEVTLVTRRERAADLKSLLRNLPDDLRPEG